MSAHDPMPGVIDTTAEEADALTDDQRGRYDEALRCGASHDDAMDAAGPARPPARRRPGCEWEGHAAAMGEAGWCPVCNEGDLDPEWAERNGVDTSLDS